METVAIGPSFEVWRDAARRLLQEGKGPEDVVWTDERTAQAELFVGEAAPKSTTASPIAVGRGFLQLAQSVACHSDPQRWALLYALLWRMTAGKERHLLHQTTDDAIVRARAMEKEVRRDMHKMRAFVRFRKVGESDTGREQFAAWFEPFHHIVRANAPFFAKRFTGMDWSILTPDECAHWNGEALDFTPGVARADAPQGDELEALWRSYYSSIFNPARMKLKAMQAEMPKKYWQNLPEASLIHELTSAADYRRGTMLAATPRASQPAPSLPYLERLGTMNAPTAVEQTGLDLAGKDLDALRRLADCCQACPLWEKATQTVFGEGPEKAEIMLIGEQPGDREDIVGRPFQGPAGELLNEALAAAGIDRGELYLTNAVKHFKWKPGRDRKRRLHDKANRDEMTACRPWLLGEIARVQPKVIVTLGNTAAQSVIRSDFKILRERGLIEGHNAVGFKETIIATVHPSFILRLKDSPEREDAFRRMVAELAQAKATARAPAGHQ